jgi:hypothetical protein
VRRRVEGARSYQRCLAEITDVHNMGKTADLQNRISQVHIDNEARRAKIAKVRRLVYEKGASINGPTVKKALGLESVVPTRVHVECLIILNV